MALFRAVETAGPRGLRLFDDPYAVSLLSGRLRALAQFSTWPLVGRLVPWLLDVGWPRTRSSGVVRTRLIDDLAREAIRDGARQLLLLGAGFDSRPYRLPEADSIAVFEVDHPATQQAKRERLQHLPANVHFVPVDFEKHDLEQALHSSGFNPECVSIAIWEGVISYLTPAAVDRNFDVLRRLLAPHSRLVFSYVHRGALDGSVTFAEARRWKWWVGRSGEPFIFGFDPAELPNYLRAYGFELRSDVSTAEAARAYCEPLARREPGSELYRIALAGRVIIA